MDVGSVLWINKNSSSLNDRCKYIEIKEEKIKVYTGLIIPLSDLQLWINHMLNKQSALVHTYVSHFGDVYKIYHVTPPML